MEFEVLGLQAAGPRLELDYREFAYAGNFVMTDSGKTVARDEGAVVGAVSFSEDRTDPSTVHLRYVTVREDRRGEGIGSRLLRFTANALHPHRYETVEISVNNPVAFRAAYRAGFVYTGVESGIAELSLTYTPDADDRADSFEDGLAVFDRRELPADQQACLDASRDGGPPPVVDLDV